LNPAQRLRLLARYGADAAPLLAASAEDAVQIPGTDYIWSELRQAARAEGVVHLADLLLRRCRLGLLCPKGGQNDMARIKAIAQPELGWSEERWQTEVDAYAKLWNASYSFCPKAS
jgi:glycerol-3-phosphate dehydrogenase